MNHLESIRKLLNRFAVWLYKKTKPKAPESPYGHFLGMQFCISRHLPKNTVFLGAGEEFERLKTATMMQEVDPIPNKDLEAFKRVYSSTKSYLRQNVSS